MTGEGIAHQFFELGMRFDHRKKFHCRITEIRKPLIKKICRQKRLPESERQTNMPALIFIELQFDGFFFCKIVRIGRACSLYRIK